MYNHHMGTWRGDGGMESAQNTSLDIFFDIGIFFYYLIYSLIINIMAYMTTGQHDDTTTQIHDDTTTRQKPPPHGHTQGWQSDIETGGRLQRREMAQTTMDTSFGPYGECIFFFIHFYWY